jgi:hypothetical protein
MLCCVTFQEYAEGLAVLACWELVVFRPKHGARALEGLEWELGTAVVLGREGVVSGPRGLTPAVPLPLPVVRTDWLIIINPCKPYHFGMRTDWLSDTIIIICQSVANLYWCMASPADDQQALESMYSIECPFSAQQRSSVVVHTYGAVTCACRGQCERCSGTSSTLLSGLV